MNRVLATDLQHVAGVPLPAITDEVMHERLRAARRRTVVLLHATGQLVRPDADPIIWEHGRRDFALREHGVLPIVLPATGDNDLAGLYIFNAPPDGVRAIMDHDPGVAAGIFTYEIYPVGGFPGSCLPEWEPASRGLPRSRRLRRNLAGASARSCRNRSPRPAPGDAAAGSRLACHISLMARSSASSR